MPLSASIGVAVSRPDVRDPHQLLSDADAAMFAAKSSGRDRVHLFSPGLREAARWRLEVATRLRGDAIDQLVVHYQPVVRLDTGEVEGVEALVRWQHPERGPAAARHLPVGRRGDRAGHPDHPVAAAGDDARRPPSGPPRACRCGCR